MSEINIEMAVVGCRCDELGLNSGDEDVKSETIEEVTLTLQGLQAPQIELRA